MTPHPPLLTRLYTWGARYKKSLREPRAEFPPQLLKLSNKQLTKKFIFFVNSWSCPQAYCGSGCRQKSPLDGAIDFPSKIWHHITAVSFFLYWSGSPQTSINTTKLGRNITEFIANFYGCVFFRVWQIIRYLNTIRIVGQTITIFYSVFGFFRTPNSIRVFK